MKELLTTRTGGAYIPPAKLRLMQESITDKSSVAFQRLAWEALKKSINGLINKVNSPNIGIIVRELFAENIVRYVVPLFNIIRGIGKGNPWGVTGSTNKMVSSGIYWWEILPIYIFASFDLQQSIFS